MRRKSERNKAKGSPEKKVEKPTRKSTRRRGRRSPSTSSEQDAFVEDAAKSTVQLKEIEETNMQTRLQSKELEHTSQGHEEKVSSSDINIKVDSPEDEDNGGSVWKVARADASPGEIQKLKLCRQRNTSEPSSDTPPSSRKSVRSTGKWQGSGEGVAEEADSADEQLVSCTRMLSSAEQPNDPSSSYPGQDSNEEVSDSKEILPETTSANLLSDDKPNIDQHGESNEANCAAQIVDIEPGKPGSPGSPTTALVPSTNGEETETTAVVKEDKPVEDTSEKSTEIFVKETSVENVRKDTSSEDEEAEEEQEEVNDKAKTLPPVDSSSDSNDESRLKRSRTSSDQTSPRAMRRKHRNKYRDSSNSETPDSEDEPVDRKVSEPYVEEEEEEEKPSTEYSQENNKEQSVSPERTNSQSNNVEKTDIEHSETIEDKSEENATEKLEQSTPASTQVVAHKPVKVNLKRSFSTRISEKNEVKRDDADATIDNESSQNKENGSEQEPKCVPRKRRWGTALSTDTAPSFSISTDSLKALVPGAKPLSINEVRLSKDDDEDRDRHRSNDKWHNSSDIINDRAADENLQKNGTAKKGTGKIDNHIATRRKISIVKEMPHMKSPSPPASKPTNILLIKNLVRPFTLNQIKELLSRTGTIVENGFWMDRIKSKCIVEYSNEDQAFETRQALHGISWPLSNPKKLHVEYATKEDMETARESSKEQPITRKTEPLSSDSWQQDWSRDEKSNTTKVTVVREWDLGKEDGQQHVREKEREKKEYDKKRRVRSRSPTLDAHLSAPARKFKKKEDDPPPAKLLDDLFRKTKATPCIYWLPLTNEQIVVKEEMRRQHMAEHARRLEEMRRADRNRDGRRRRSPRK
ncbi:apoptotic chromatin condensation inducer in the nucleus [Monomorium pharaonis]|uniref:apoptotic chromatin condensation inducer in the nucleus n=1 Tax=Monomorium pharaonis TaxID=307658 RepID=UPI00063F1EF2|nr:apoptotic chromatin condensation inducer in the nucleus [Monomorium pharaonis]XP_012534252.1 apoptotic chromatin condensation inducer in the nucleus [Monomorium pharaonis]XP_012534262.1 apoptotic chromatin condensation inducer in the nucleus [Monomorium pharaonis]XP_028049033.1 apoptotic chromatin condensation inducer in the nucleus [Monomorium pharaonis]